MYSKIRVCARPLVRLPARPPARLAGRPPVRPPVRDGTRRHRRRRRHARRTAARVRVSACPRVFARPRVRLSACPPGRHTRARVFACPARPLLRMRACLFGRPFACPCTVRLPIVRLPFLSASPCTVRLPVRFTDRATALSVRISLHHPFTCPPILVLGGSFLFLSFFCVGVRVYVSHSGSTEDATQ